MLGYTVLHEISIDQVSEQRTRQPIFLTNLSVDTNPRVSHNPAGQDAPPTVIG